MPCEIIWIAEMFFDFPCIFSSSKWALKLGRCLFMSSSPEETIWYVRLSLPRLGTGGCWGLEMGCPKFTKEMGQIKRWRPEMYARDVLCILGL